MKKTYEVGVGLGGYGASDWISPVSKIIHALDKSHVLEFGLGNGTQYWVENFDNVTSVELSIGANHKSWTEKTKQNLKDYNNWNCNYVDCPPEIFEANSQAVQHKYPMSYQDHLPVLRDVCTPFLCPDLRTFAEYSFIMVDAGIHNRGDIVNLCFNHSPIIAAHDTGPNIIKNIYGYNIVEPPSCYVRIDKPSGLGTTFWVRDDQTQILEALQV